jgi:hypothetical protein
MRRACAILLSAAFTLFLANATIARVNGSSPSSDLYIMRRVIHGWSDERARLILSGGETLLGVAHS